MNRRCLRCRTLIAAGTYCPRCQPYNAAWRQLSAAVIQRDHGVCWICGEAGADTADHVVPVARGGRSVMANLRAAHRACNSGRRKGGL